MHKSPVVEWFGIQFDLAAILMIVVSTVIVMILASIGTRNMSVDKPSKMQNFMEWIVEFVQNLIASAMDMKRGRPFILLGVTVIMYIFVSNMLGLPINFITEHHHPFTLFGTEVISQADINTAVEKGHEGVELAWFKSPTADMAVTFGLALPVILLSHYLGAFRNTRAYFKHYLEPNPVFLPLNIIKEISKLLSLGLRLFGNIYAGEMLISILLMAGVWGIIPLIAWQGFSIFVGAIQAFVFTILTMVYIAQATERHDHH